MSDMVIGKIVQTTPPSTPLDTLKALVLRNVEQLEYVIDRLADNDCGVPDDVLEFIDMIKQGQYAMLGEHVHVALDERLNELRHIHPDGYRYSDGTPVVEEFKGRYGASTYYPRYDGPRDKALAKHEEWTGELEKRMKTEAEFDNIIREIDFGDE